MPANPSSIRFHFDYISHNAYVAWFGLKSLAEKFGRDIEPVPTLFAELLNAHNNVGPAEVRAKARWMIRDVMRKAIDLEIPLEPPYSHPFHPLLSLRATGTFRELEPRRAATEALFNATWATSQDVSNADVVRKALDEAGLDGGAAVAEASEPPAKERLRTETDAAVAEGVFGVPSIVIEGRLFFGYDDLINVDRYLSGDDPIEEIEIPSWSHVKPTAQRKR